MEHIEIPHALTPDNTQIPSFMPHLTPKTRCNHCCLHQCSSFPREDSQRQPVMSFCTGNFCTQTCFSSNHRYNRPSTNVPSCNCHNEIPHMRSYMPPPPAPPPLPPPLPPPPAATATRCPCINRHHVDALEQLHRYHISHAYLTTENLTYPPPQYAMAHFANSYSWTPSPHHITWEASGGYRDREYHTHERGMSESVAGATQEYPSHIHHHISHHTNHAVSTNATHLLRDQALYTFASRPYRRHSARIAPHPYSLHHPLMEHVDYRAYPNAYPYLLTPRTHLHFPAALALTGELEVEPLDGEWVEDGGVVEPMGLKKEQINKLPSYVVAKKTMEEFTENERCVVCMCEFDIDDRLRILPCAHEFHSDCVDKWLMTNPTCPICRAVVEVT